MCTGFWRGNLREREHWGEPDVDGKIILKCIEGRDVTRFLVGKPEGYRPLGCPRRRWDYNIKIEGGQRCSQGSGR
jgi:hypothetical protein